MVKKLNNKICTEKKLQNIDDKIKKYVKEEKRLSWKHYQRPFIESKEELLDIFNLFDNNDIKDDLRNKISSIDDLNFSELEYACKEPCLYSK